MVNPAKTIIRRSPSPAKANTYGSAFSTIKPIFASAEAKAKPLGPSTVYEPIWRDWASCFIIILRA